VGAQMHSLNNREIAGALWLVILLGMALLKSSRVRGATLRLLGTMCSKAIVVSAIAMLVYVAGAVLALRALHVWDPELLKDTVVWTAGVGVSLLFAATQVDDHFFRRAIRRTVAVTAVIEFLANLHVFALWVEVLVLPGVLFVVLLKTVADADPRYRLVAKLLQWPLLIYGAAVVGYSVRAVVREPGSLVSATALRTFLLTPILTVAYVPFIYGFALYLQYEAVFVRLQFVAPDPHFRRQSKRTVFRRFGLNLWALNRWVRAGGIVDLAEPAA
jgi:hypothetical protein